MTQSESFAMFEATSRQEWRTWLQANYEASPGVWLVTYRPRGSQPRLRYEEAVEEALCFGWIDSQTKAIDEARSRQLYTPRRRGSPWSRPNKQRIERLMAAEMMRPAGLAKIDAAKRDGSWEIYDAVEDLVIPDDLAAALAAVPGASAGFDALGVTARKQLLWLVVSAKRPETRANRIERVAAGAGAGDNPLAYQRKRS